MQIKIITGLSGAGKSTVINKLEDLGYYSIDNLPPQLLGKFLDLIVASGSKTEKVALVIDIRGRAFFDDLEKSLLDLKKSYPDSEIVFLEASTSSLVKRFKETRRAHPLSMGDSDLISGIETEIEMTKFLRDMADRVIDTTDMKRRDLDALLVKAFSESSPSEVIEIEMVSFGFKNGIPVHADMVFDVRFIENPYYVPELKPLTGVDAAVYDYVFSSQVADTYYKTLSELLDLTFKQYVIEARSQLTVAIGCTGGRHRSVAFVERLSKDYINKGYNIEKMHRDLDKK